MRDGDNAENLRYLILSSFNCDNLLIREQIINCFSVNKNQIK